jgi:hypothetical protein
LIVIATRLLMDSASLSALIAGSTAAPHAGLGFGRRGRGLDLGVPAAFVLDEYDDHKKAVEAARSSTRVGIMCSPQRNNSNRGYDSQHRRISFRLEEPR